MNIGDKVAYSVDFLRSIGVFTGDMPAARGVIENITELGQTKLATIKWDSEEIPPKVNVKNLAKVGLNTKFCKC